MQKQKSKSPEIRFKEYTDAWEQRRFVELLDEVDGIRRGPFGSALKKELFVAESNYVVYEQQNAIYDKWETRYNITKEKFEELHKFKLLEDDFILSGAGTIGRIAKVPKGIKQGVFNQALIRLRINKDEVDSNYFLEWIRSDKMQRKFTGANPGSAITNLVPMSEVKKWEVMIPTKKEQYELGVFFSNLDNLIILHQRKLEILQNNKKSLVQKMFPKKGQEIPEVRFPGFTGAWEQRKFGELLEEFNIKSKSEDEYTVLSSTNSGMEVRDGRVSGASNLGYKIIEDGDLVLSPQNLWLGNINVNDIGKGLVSPSYRTFKFVDLDKQFIEPQLRIPRMLEEYKNSSTQGASVVRRNLEMESFYQIPIRVPNCEEQKIIGFFFKQLDNTITLHQCKLETLKEYKKTMLQKMFI
ncbi:restriction endonuclease subunit S [Ornithinibacillus gellani]|uniref:restriction endonuclease subunit S n=1 Tax=Ornithinibacillus gellani TaxID=2293253 RepID=UPI000F45FF4E|nr:restriction endonuclease subunit S [Ornithinibacillus gellani]TQS71922.1 restriction endonuclease subunit S [Ornithinibacillus gellani]